MGIQNTIDSSPSEKQCMTVKMKLEKIELDNEDSVGYTHRDSHNRIPKIGS